MDNRLFGFLAETSIHPGSGQDAGLIDLPVAREATTDYPVVVGSAMKGAFRDLVYWREFDKQTEAGEQRVDAVKKSEARADHYFGKPDQAGPILVSDLRLLLLPVRSLTSNYYWVTCPYLIERCSRDERRNKQSGIDVSNWNVDDEHFLGAAELPETVYLEELQFSRGGELPTDLTEFLGKYIPHPASAARLPKQLVVLSDKSFSWYARYGLAVTARNVLDRDTKTSKNLWYEETIPPDSLFYCILAGRSAKVLGEAASELTDASYIQVGGNETVGQGWFAIQSVLGQAKDS